MKTPTSEVHEKSAFACDGSLTSSEHEHREGQSRRREHLDEQSLRPRGAVAQDDAHEERTGREPVDERGGYDAAYHLCDGDD
jgi:hypothetical protein